MTPVSFPLIEETFKRAIYEVVSPFLVGGGTLPCGGSSIAFYDCDIHWNIENVNQPSTKPRVGFIGSRVSTGNPTQKCTANDRPLGYVDYQTLSRSVYVSAPRSLSIIPPQATLSRIIGQQDLDAVYSQVAAVINTQSTAFADRGIFKARMVVTPIQATDAEYFVLYGAFTCEVRYGYSKD